VCELSGLIRKELSVREADPLIPAEQERSMKVQEAILIAITRKLKWWQAA
jgi:hypothetical protein